LRLGRARSAEAAAAVPAEPVAGRQAGRGLARMRSPGGSPASWLRRGTRGKKGFAALPNFDFTWTEAEPRRARAASRAKAGAGCYAGHV